MDIATILSVLDPQVLLYMMGGVFLGIGFGCIPGLNTPMALAVVLPLTYGMPTIAGISTLLAVYCGGLSGGLISAILLRMPGTAAAVTTTFDGYPMAQKGLAMKALSLGVISSLFGGIFSAIILMFLTPYLAAVALGFGPWEYFGATILSLSMVATLVKGDLIKGFIACCIGLLIACVGSSPIDGAIRFSFGQYQLSGGVSIVVLIIGFFAVSEMLSTAGKSLKPLEKGDNDLSFREFLRTFKDFKGEIINLFRSASLGTAIGVLPGLGGNAASLMAYTTARRFSKNPEEFGEGHKSGIIAPEAANNAISGGAMIPMLALGVPGSSPVALIMGAFIVHGVTIGPLLIQDSPELVKAIFIALIVANIMMFVLQSVLLRFYARIIYVSKYVLLPLLVVFCVMGAYIANNSLFDIGLLIGFGTFGYLLEKNGFPMAPIIMGYVLGGLVELYYRRSIIYHTSFSNAFFTPSLGTVLVILAIVIPLFSIIKEIRTNASKKAVQNS